LVPSLKFTCTFNVALPVGEFALEDSTARVEKLPGFVKVSVPEPPLGFRISVPELKSTLYDGPFGLVNELGMPAEQPFAAGEPVSVDTKSEE